MISGATCAARVPRDPRARERLREAQQQEAQALVDVCVAQESVAKACAKCAAVLAAATASVDRAQNALESAQAALVRVSGVDRAAMLLAAKVGDLRKIAAAAAGHAAGREHLGR